MTKGSNFSLPQTFPIILKEVTRSILRASPNDIDLFCAEYFSQQLRNLSLKAPAKGRTTIACFVNSQNDNVLSNYFRNLFLGADNDQSGYLCPREFRIALDNMSEQFGFTRSEKILFMASADTNQDGLISYEEFLEPAIDLVRRILSGQEPQPNATSHQTTKREHSSHVHGINRELWIRLLEKAFRRADANGDGVLDEREFAKCLGDEELGLTTTEVLVLRSEADSDQNGYVSYNEYLEACANLATELQYDLSIPIPRDLEQTTKYLDFAFSQGARNLGINIKNIGEDQIVDILLQADIGLPRSSVVQIVNRSECLGGSLDLTQIVHNVAHTLNGYFT